MCKFQLALFFVVFILAQGALGWIRFRYPYSRRVYLEQTSLERLQNCAGLPEEQCGLCGEGPNELQTTAIPEKNYLRMDLLDTTLQIEVGFREDLGGHFEFRVCEIGSNMIQSARRCRDVEPLVIGGDRKSYLPIRRQTSARLPVDFPAGARCEKCVLQVKYTPDQTPASLENFTYYDCAPINLTVPGIVAISPPARVSPSGQSVTASRTVTINSSSRRGSENPRVVSVLLNQRTGSQPTARLFINGGTTQVGGRLSSGMLDTGVSSQNAAGFSGVRENTAQNSIADSSFLNGEVFNGVSNNNISLSNPTRVSLGNITDQNAISEGMNNIQVHRSVNIIDIRSNTLGNAGQNTRQAAPVTDNAVVTDNFKRTTFDNTLVGNFEGTSVSDNKIANGNQMLGRFDRLSNDNNAVVGGFDRTVASGNSISGGIDARLSNENTVSDRLHNTNVDVNTITGRFDKTVVSNRIISDGFDSTSLNRNTLMGDNNLRRDTTVADGMADILSIDNTVSDGLDNSFINGKLAAGARAAVNGNAVLGNIDRAVVNGNTVSGASDITVVNGNNILNGDPNTPLVNSNTVSGDINKTPVTGNIILLEIDKKAVSNTGIAGAVDKIVDENAVISRSGSGVDGTINTISGDTVLDSASVSDIAQNTKEVIENTVSNTVDIVKDTKEVIDNTVSNAVDIVKDTKEVIDNTVSNAVDIVKDTNEVISNSVSNAADSVTDTKEVIDNTVSNAVDIVKDTKEVISNTVSNAVDGINDNIVGELDISQLGGNVVSGSLTDTSVVQNNVLSGTENMAVGINTVSGGLNRGVINNMAASGSMNSGFIGSNNVSGSLDSATVNNNVVLGGLDSTLTNTNSSIGGFENAFVSVKTASGGIDTTLVSDNIISGDLNREALNENTVSGSVNGPFVIGNTITRDASKTIIRDNPVSSGLDRTFTNGNMVSVSENLDSTTSIGGSFSGDFNGVKNVNPVSEMLDTTIVNRNVGLSKLDGKVLGDTIPANLDTTIVNRNVVTGGLNDRFVNDNTISGRFDRTVVSGNSLSSGENRLIVNDNTVPGDLNSNFIHGNTVSNGLELTRVNNNTVAGGLSSTVVNSNTNSNGLERTAIYDTTITGGLDSTVVNGNMVSSGLDKAITYENTITGGLDSSIANGNTVSNRLDGVVIYDNTITSGLDSSVVNDNRVSNGLDRISVDSTIANGNTVSSGLDISVAYDNTLPGGFDNPISRGVDRSTIGNTASQRLDETSVSRNTGSRDVGRLTVSDTTMSRRFDRANINDISQSSNAVSNDFGRTSVTDKNIIDGLGNTVVGQNTISGVRKDFINDITLSAIERTYVNDRSGLGGFERTYITDKSIPGGFGRPHVNGNINNGRFDRPSVAVEFAKGNTLLDGSDYSRYDGFDRSFVRDKPVANGSNKQSIIDTSMSSGVNRVSLVDNTLSTGFERTSVVDNTVSDRFDRASVVDNTVSSGFDRTSVKDNTVSSGFDRTSVNDNTVSSGFDRTSVNDNTVSSGFDRTSVNDNTVISGFDRTSVNDNTVSSGFDGTSVVGNSNSVSGGFDRSAVMDNAVTGIFDRTSAIDKTGSSRFDRTTVIDNNVSNGFDRTSVVDNTVTGRFDRTSVVDNTVSDGFERASVVDNNISDGLDKTSVVDNTVSGGFDRTSAIDNTVSGGFDKTTIVDNAASGGFDRPSVVDNTLSSGFDGTSVVENNVSDRFDKTFVRDNTLSGVIGRTSVVDNTASRGIDRISVVDNTASNRFDRTPVVDNTISSGVDITSVRDNTLSDGFDRTSVMDNSVSGGFDRTSVIDNTVSSGFDRISVNDNTVSGGFERTSVADNTVSGKFDRASIVDNTVSGGFDRTSVRDNTVSSGFDRAAVMANTVSGGFDGTSIRDNTRSGVFDRQSVVDITVPDEFGRTSATDNIILDGFGRTSVNHNIVLEGSGNRNRKPDTKLPIVGSVGVTPVTDSTVSVGFSRTSASDNTDISGLDRTIVTDRSTIVDFDRTPVNDRISGSSDGTIASDSNISTNQILISTNSVSSSRTGPPIITSNDVVSNLDRTMTSDLTASGPLDNSSVKGMSLNQDINSTNATVQQNLSTNNSGSSSVSTIETFGNGPSVLSGIRLPQDNTFVNDYSVGLTYAVDSSKDNISYTTNNINNFSGTAVVQDTAKRTDWNTNTWYEAAPSETVGVNRVSETLNQTRSLYDISSIDNLTDRTKEPLSLKQEIVSVPNTITVFPLDFITPNPVSFDATRYADKKFNAKPILPSTSAVVYDSIVPDSTMKQPNIVYDIRSQTVEVPLTGRETSITSNSISVDSPSNIQYSPFEDEIIPFQYPETTTIMYDRRPSSNIDVSAIKTQNGNTNQQRVVEASYDVSGLDNTVMYQPSAGSASSNNGFIYESADAATNYTLMTVNNTKQDAHASLIDKTVTSMQPSHNNIDNLQNTDTKLTMPVDTTTYYPSEAGFIYNEVSTPIPHTLSVALDKMSTISKEIHNMVVKKTTATTQEITTSPKYETIRIDDVTTSATPEIPYVSREVVNTDINLDTPVGVNGLIVTHNKPNYLIDSNNLIASGALEAQSKFLTTTLEPPRIVFEDTVTKLSEMKDPVFKHMTTEIPLPVKTTDRSKSPIPQHTGAVEMVTITNPGAVYISRNPVAIVNISKSTMGKTGDGQFIDLENNVDRYGGVPITATNGNSGAFFIASKSGSKSISSGSRNSGFDVTKSVSKETVSGIGGIHTNSADKPNAGFVVFNFSGSDIVLGNIARKDNTILADVVGHSNTNLNNIKLKSDSSNVLDNVKDSISSPSLDVSMNVVSSNDIGYNTSDTKSTNIQTGNKIVTLVDGSSSLKPIVPSTQSTNELKGLDIDARSSVATNTVWRGRGVLGKTTLSGVTKQQKTTNSMSDPITYHFFSLVNGNSPNQVNNLPQLSGRTATTKKIRISSSGMSSEINTGRPSIGNIRKSTKTFNSTTVSADSSRSNKTSSTLWDLNRQNNDLADVTKETSIDYLTNPTFQTDITGSFTNSISPSRMDIDNVFIDQQAPDIMPPIVVRYENKENTYVVQEPVNSRPVEPVNSRQTEKEVSRQVTSNSGDINIKILQTLEELVTELKIRNDAPTETTYETSLRTQNDTTIDSNRYNTIVNDVRSSVDSQQNSQFKIVPHTNLFYSTDSINTAVPPPIKPGVAESGALGFNEIGTVQLGNLKGVTGERKWSVNEKMQVKGADKRVPESSLYQDVIRIPTKNTNSGRIFEILTGAFANTSAIKRAKLAKVITSNSEVPRKILVTETQTTQTVPEIIQNDTIIENIARPQAVIHATQKQIQNPFAGTNIDLDHRTVHKIGHRVAVPPQFREAPQSILASTLTTSQTEQNSQTNTNQNPISIEGKYYVGEMRRNAFGQFEPVPVGSDILLQDNNLISNKAKSNTGMFTDSAQHFGSVNSFPDTNTLEAQRIENMNNNMFVSQGALLNMIKGQRDMAVNIPVNIEPASEPPIRIDIAEPTNMPIITPSVSRESTGVIKMNKNLPKSLSPSPQSKTLVCEVGSQFACKAVGSYRDIPGMVWWCFSHCKNGVCPREKCDCSCSFDSSKDRTTVVVQESKPRVKKVINLTLNGAEESVVPVGDTFTGLTSQNDYQAGVPPSPARRSFENTVITKTPARNAIRNLDQSSAVCRGINAFANTKGMDNWCTTMCRRNVCPPEICGCSY